MDDEDMLFADDLLGDESFFEKRSPSTGGFQDRPSSTDSASSLGGRLSVRSSEFGESVNNRVTSGFFSSPFPAHLIPHLLVLADSSHLATVSPGKRLKVLKDSSGAFLCVRSKNFARGLKEPSPRIGFVEAEFQVNSEKYIHLKISRQRLNITGNIREEDVTSLFRTLCRKFEEALDMWKEYENLSRDDLLRMMAELPETKGGSETNLISLYVKSSRGRSSLEDLSILLHGAIQEASKLTPQEKTANIVGVENFNLVLTHRTKIPVIFKNFVDLPTRSGFTVRYHEWIDRSMNIKVDGLHTFVVRGTGVVQQYSKSSAEDAERAWNEVRRFLLGS